LRTFSRLTAERAKDSAGDSNATPDRKDDVKKEDDPGPTRRDDGDNDEPALATMTGTLQSFVDRARPVYARIVTSLAKTLGFSLQDDVSSVTKAGGEFRRDRRFAGRGRGRRGGSGRRDLLREIAEKWPDLADERHWEESPLLKPENQENLLAELKQLPGWKPFEERLKQREAASDESEKRELRTVKIHRLTSALETIVLETNLPQVAGPEIVKKYHELIALEGSTLDSK
jgi:hypothetical protein